MTNHENWMQPLGVAAKHGHLEVVNLLLEAGSNPLYKDRSNQTAYDRAARALRYGGQNAGQAAGVQLSDAKKQEYRQVMAALQSATCMCGLLPRRRTAKNVEGSRAWAAECNGLPAKLCGHFKSLLSGMVRFPIYLIIKPWDPLVAIGGMLLILSLIHI